MLALKNTADLGVALGKNYIPLEFEYKKQPVLPGIYDGFLAYSFRG
jgi:hypothetical protein